MIQEKYQIKPYPLHCVTTNLYLKVHKDLFVIELDRILEIKIYPSFIGLTLYSITIWIVEFTRQIFCLGDYRKIDTLFGDEEELNVDKKHEVSGSIAFRKIHSNHLVLFIFI